MPGGTAARRYSCASTSEAGDEPVLGTASPARGWLLVEEPGPWGPGAVPSSRLGAEATAALRRTAEDAGMRLLLVRRPDAPRRREAQERTVLRVTCTRGAERVLERSAAPADLVAAAAAEDGWRERPGPLLLVCTHGRKDWCCAVRGRPVVAALAALAPQEVWECSHLGGDRFAATVLDLPSGTMHGRVTPADAPALLAAVRSGRVLPRLLRGRCTDAMVVQAAEAHARAVLGRDGLGDLRPLAAHRLDDGATWRVRFRAPRPGGAQELVQVLVRAGSAARTQRLTCSAAEEQHPRTWELLDVAVAPGPPA